MWAFGDILKGVELVRTARKESKKEFQEFLFDVAREAKMLADVWANFLYILERQTDPVIAQKECQESILHILIAQTDMLYELEVFYRLISEKYPETTNGEFILALHSLINSRCELRAFVEESNYKVTDWSDTKLRSETVTSLQGAVINLKKEAARLSALAKSYMLI